MQDFCIFWLKVYAYFIKTPKILAITDSEAGEVEEMVVISKRFANFGFLNGLIPSLWNSKYVINIFIPLGKKSYFLILSFLVKLMFYHHILISAIFHYFDDFRSKTFIPFFLFLSDPTVSCVVIGLFMFLMLPRLLILHYLVCGHMYHHNYFY